MRYRFFSKYSLVLYVAALTLGVFFMHPLVVSAACGFHNITGYVWSRNIGWVSLNCSAGGTVDYGLDIDFASGSPSENVTGYAWSPHLGWLHMEPSGPYPSAPSYSARFDRNLGGSPTTTAGVITGWAQWTALGSDGWMLMGPLDIGGTDYGVGIGSDRLFTGWSWNGGSNIDVDANPERGDGWILWDSVQSGGGASVLAYWFETLYGDIYTAGNIAAPFAPAPNRYTATYLIQADGTVQPVTIQSQAGDGDPYTAESFGALSIPDAANSYEGSLGTIDRTGMLNGYYGDVVTYNGDQTTSGTLGTSKLLDGKIYHYTGNLTVNSSLTFSKGTSAQKGSGTIIVDGNVTINANVQYESGAVASNIANLPSVAWMVAGNMTIDQSVTEVVGLLYSEGTISTGTTGSSLSDVPIIIRGMMIAQTLNLQRIYVTETHDPAEQVIFDGRAIANPPPGMVDFIKALPSIREVTPA